MKILRERAAAVFPKPQGKKDRFQRYLQVRESKQHKKSTNRQKNLKTHTQLWQLWKQIRLLWIGQEECQDRQRQAARATPDLPMKFWLQPSAHW
jgi:hypothetical protein